ncbi:MarR family winged helix-turn-helix transcriptional regulator [Nakamurella deserti]|uniref:MarR family winged helix-turn-helix transcriptional regulator n=1 Tax=Nakamurella deserti TaxID=2164074 RepID=UPI00197BE5FD|nr:MarR family transcriptional regulator [Nakamurella deserti]
MEEPRWLSAAELSTWMSLAKLMVVLPSTLDSRLQRESGLTYFEYMVLAALSDRHDHRMRMSDLAAFANGSVSRLSHVARRLEAQGLVRREPSPDDRRSILMALTDDGRARMVAAAPDHVDAVRSHVMDPLTPEQVAQLGVIADRITATMDPDAC